MVKKTHRLMHPLNGVYGPATQEGFYFINGKSVGLVLLFPCGHVASLTFAEIRKYKEETNG